MQLQLVDQVWPEWAQPGQRQLMAAAAIAKAVSMVNRR
jgi:hypothetical protein